MCVCVVFISSLRVKSLSTAGECKYYREICSHKQLKKVVHNSLEEVVVCKLKKELTIIYLEHINTQTKQTSRILEGERES